VDGPAAFHATRVWPTHMQVNERLRTAAAYDVRERTVDFDSIPLQSLKYLAAAEFQVLTRGVPFRMEEGFGAFEAAMVEAGRTVFWPGAAQGRTDGTEPAGKQIYFCRLVTDDCMLKLLYPMPLL
jgi:hypothetical protein